MPGEPFGQQRQKVGNGALAGELVEAAVEEPFDGLCSKHAGELCDGCGEAVDSPGQVGVGGFERGIGVARGRVGHRPVQVGCRACTQLLVGVVAHGHDQVLVVEHLLEVVGVGVAKV